MALKAGRVGVYPQDLDSTGHIRNQDPPEPYVLPVASASALGGVKPVAKTSDMTQDVGVSEDGELFTIPSSGTEIYYADFNTTRDGNGDIASANVNKVGYSPIGCGIISRYSGYSAYGGLYYSGSEVFVYGHTITHGSSADGCIARVYYIKGTPTQLTT